VNSKSNKLLKFSVATEVDYIDIFRYKSVFQNQTALKLIQCPNAALNPFEPISPIEEGRIIAERSSIKKKDKSLDLNSFDKIRNKGFPDNYSEEYNLSSNQERDLNQKNFITLSKIPEDDQIEIIQTGFQRQEEGIISLKKYYQSTAEYSLFPLKGYSIRYEAIRKTNLYKQLKP